MKGVEASPAGAIRERAVPCVSCKTPTWNHSARCDVCRALCVPEPETPDPHDQADVEALMERYER